MKIKLRNTHGGDWAQLWVDDRLYYEGHSIPEHIWLEVIAKLGEPLRKSLTRTPTHESR